MLQKINIQKTAIVVIDLQNGITTIPTEPYSSKVVIENTVKLLSVVREKGMPVFLVHLTPSPDMKDALRPLSESTFRKREYDPSWSKFVPERT